METAHMPESLPLWRKWMYALGQLGWSLTSFAVLFKLVYFFLPPEGIPMGPFVEQGYILPLITHGSQVLFGFTIIGLVFASGRFFDAITDPLIAILSDKCTLKWGKRKSFLILSAFPFALFSALVFFPLTSGISAINTIWLFASCFLFYLFMTMYVTPYFALLSEIAHTSKERLQLSTFIAITWALGTMIGSQIEVLQSVFMTKAGLSATHAFQVVVVIYAVVGFLLMLCPIIFIDEKKYARSETLNLDFWDAMKSIFKNKNFLFFTLSDLCYWISITIINTSVVYYISTLAELPISFAGLINVFIFLLSFVCYIPVNWLVAKYGKKNMLLIAFAGFSLSFLYIAGIGTYPWSSKIQTYILPFLTAIPLATFSIVQNAMIGDMAEVDALLTHNAKAGLYFGTRTFMSKLGQTIAGLMIPSLLIIGITEIPQENLQVVKDLSSGQAVVSSLGVRITAFVASVFCIIGMLLLFLYNEKELTEVLAQKQEL